MLKNYMKQLAKEMELEGTFDTDVPGVFAIPLEEDTLIQVQSTPKGFAMNCTFGAVPGKHREEFYTHALLANLLGKGTDGAILGLDGEGKRMRLSQEIETNVDYQEFENIIEDFINSIDFWVAEAQSYATNE